MKKKGNASGGINPQSKPRKPLVDKEKMRARNKKIKGDIIKFFTSIKSAFKKAKEHREEKKLLRNSNNANKKKRNEKKISEIKAKVDTHIESINKLDIPEIVHIKEATTQIQNYVNTEDENALGLAGLALDNHEKEFPELTTESILNNLPMIVIVIALLFLIFKK